MLLVDDDEAERRKATSSWMSAWVPTAMSAPPAASAREPRFALGRRERAGEQRDAHGEIAEEAPEVRVVLLGQHLGGGHERRLVAALHGDQGGA